jgi:arylformamidase
MRRHGIWIDVTIPLADGMVRWPGDPEVVVERFATVEADGANVTRIAMCAHTGTHLDAPLHYVDNGAAVDAAPLDALVGTARVIEVADSAEITATELAACHIRRGERLLFRTRNSRRCWRQREFCPDYVAIGSEAARFLVERGVRTVGVDYLSVGKPGPEGDNTHRILLGAGVWVIEGLDLSAAAAGRYEMLCLALRLAGGDGAPCRVVLRPLGNGRGKRRGRRSS